MKPYFALLFLALSPRALQASQRIEYKMDYTRDDGISVKTHHRLLWDSSTRSCAYFREEPAFLGPKTPRTIIEPLPESSCNIFEVARMLREKHFTYCQSSEIVLMPEREEKSPNPRNASSLHKKSINIDRDCLCYVWEQRSSSRGNSQAKTAATSEQCAQLFDSPEDKRLIRAVYAEIKNK